MTSPKHEQSWKGAWAPREEFDGIPYYRTGLVRKGRIPFKEEISIIHALKKRIKEVIEIEKPDILHAHSPFFNAISAMQARRKLGIPVIYEIRAFWEDAAVDHRTFKENSIKYNMVRSIETRVCRKVDHIAILCEGLKQDLVQRGIPEEKISVVYNGINPDDFSHSEPDPEFKKKWCIDGKTVIGFIGSFYRYEGLDLLVQTFSHLASRYPSLTLLLVGGGGEMEAEFPAPSVIRHQELYN